MDSEVSCHILAMVLYYLTLGTSQSSRTLFPLFAAKTLSRIFDSFCKFSNKVAIPESAHVPGPDMLGIYCDQGESNTLSINCSELSLMY